MQVVGISGPLCTAQEVTANGKRDDFECRSTVTMTLQEPDRVDPIPTRILLVALSAAADTAYATVLSEAELHPGVSSITLPDARTFDWYLVQGGVQVTNEGPSLAQLLQMAQRSTMAYTMPIPGTTVSETNWVQMEGIMTGDELPGGEARNRKIETVTFRYTLTATTMDDERSTSVELVSTSGTRNVRDIYVAVEETLGSGRKLRTYFDVWANTQLTYLPKSFFDAERRCLDRMTKVIDYIDYHYTESAPRVLPHGPPPHVPRTRETVVNQFATIRANAPELIERATRALAANQPPAKKGKGGKTERPQ